MKEILLSQGKVALVDDADFALVNQWKWTALNVCGKFYAIRRPHVNGKPVGILMHRFLLGAKHGGVVDHVNGNGLDNRRCNIREASIQQNVWNNRKHSRPTTSRFKGVCWSKHMKKWGAAIKKNYKRHNLGYFHSEVDAARAYNRKAQEFFGEFAQLNVIEGEHNEKINSKHGSRRAHRAGHTAVVRGDTLHGAG